MAMVEDVVIVGAGIAGLATALALKRVGIQALVLERAQELRAAGAALTLFPNAWLALDALGVSQKLTSLYKPFSKAYITNLGNGVIQEVSFAGTDRGIDAPRTIHRKALLEALAEELSTNKIRFSSKLIAIEASEHEGSSIATICLEDGTEIKTKILIGCDGVNSVVAHWLGLDVPVHSGRSAVRGLAVYPQGHGLRHEFQQFLDVGKRGGFVPLNDTEVYWFFICKSSFIGGDMAPNPELIQRGILENYAKDFPPIFFDVVRHSDLSSLTFAPLLLRYPWSILFGNLSKGTILVVGDAMHPMTPDLGQGGCSALEDAVDLGRKIGESILIQNGMVVFGETTKAVERYVKERRWRVARLIAISYLSGWVQHDGAGWWMKFIRDVVFYKFLYKKIWDVTFYDCGRLPDVSSSSESDNLEA